MSSKYLKTEYFKNRPLHPCFQNIQYLGKKRPCLSNMYMILYPHVKILDILLEIKYFNSLLLVLIYISIIIAIQAFTPSISTVMGAS